LEFVRRAVKQRYLAQSEADFLGEEGDGMFEWCRGTGLPHSRHGILAPSGGKTIVLV
jgi:hypothetical protein